jgi:hypothetical protein
MRLPSITTPLPDMSAGAAFCQGRATSGMRWVTRIFTTESRRSPSGEGAGAVDRARENTTREASIERLRERVAGW